MITSDHFLNQRDLSPKTTGIKNPITIASATGYSNEQFCSCDIGKTIHTTTGQMTGQNRQPTHKASDLKNGAQAIFSISNSSAIKVRSSSGMERFSKYRFRKFLHSQSYLIHIRTDSAVISPLQTMQSLVRQNHNPDTCSQLQSPTRIFWLLIAQRYFVQMIRIYAMFSQ